MIEFEVAAQEDADLKNHGKPTINKFKKLSLFTDVLSEYVMEDHQELILDLLLELWQRGFKRKKDHLSFCSYGRSRSKGGRPSKKWKPNCEGSRVTLTVTFQRLSREWMSWIEAWELLVKLARLS
ncbi:hypothetical protein V8G54_009328 [Vigna mungo]|uniref:Uncharacterized protein n=1 Tax=Vigna mungo TaxID=3915 RepID=A0AAQ3NTS6_VIGMU